MKSCVTPIRGGRIDAMRSQEKARLSAGLFASCKTDLLCTLSAAHDVLVGRRLAQESALHHPVDLLLELGGLVALDAGQLGQEAALAQLRLEITQQLGARAALVLGEPFD